MGATADFGIRTFFHTSLALISSLSSVSRSNSGSAGLAGSVSFVAVEVEAGISGDAGEGVPASAGAVEGVALEFDLLPPVDAAGEGKVEGLSFWPKVGVSWVSTKFSPGTEGIFLKSDNVGTSDLTDTESVRDSDTIRNSNARIVFAVWLVPEFRQGRLKYFIFNRKVCGADSQIDLPLSSRCSFSALSIT